MNEFTTNIYADGNSISFFDFYYLVNSKLSEIFVYNGEWEFDESSGTVSFTVYFLAEDLWEAFNILNEALKELEELQISITWDKPSNIEY